MLNIVERKKCKKAKNRSKEFCAKLEKLTKSNNKKNKQHVASARWALHECSRAGE